MFYAAIDYRPWQQQVRQDDVQHIIWLRQDLVYLALAVENTNKSLGSGLCGDPDDLFVLGFVFFFPPWKNWLSREDLDFFWRGGMG